MTLFFPLVKADEERKLIYARATAEEIDKSKEILDYASAVPAFQKWSRQYADATLGKSHGNLRAQHDPRRAVGRINEIIYNDADKTIDVVAKVVDPVDWQKVCDGVYTGLSIGGGYAGKWPDPLHKGVTRYTPRISEISLVDAPCVNSARILEMQKADGSKEDVLLKGVPRSFDELQEPRTFDELGKANLSAALHSAGRGIATVGRHYHSVNMVGAGLGGHIGRTVGRVQGYVTPTAIALEGGKLAVDKLRQRRKRVTKQEILDNLTKSATSGLAQSILHSTAAAASGSAAGATVAGLINKPPRRRRSTKAAKQEILANLQKYNPMGVARAAVGVARGKFFGPELRSGLDRRAADRTPYLRRQKKTDTGKLVATGLAAGGAGVAADRATRKQEILGNLQKATPGPTNTSRAWTGDSAFTKKKIPWWGSTETAQQPRNRNVVLTRTEPSGDLAKVSPEQRAKIAQTLHEHKAGTLRSWRGRDAKTGKPRKGPKVTSRQQALAIAMSQARRMGKSEPAFVMALASRMQNGYA